jgi:hypothetical protein
MASVPAEENYIEAIGCCQKVPTLGEGISFNEKIGHSLYFRI